MDLSNHRDQSRREPVTPASPKLQLREVYEGLDVVEGFLSREALGHSRSRANRDDVRVQVGAILECKDLVYGAERLSPADSRATVERMIGVALYLKEGKGLEYFRDGFSGTWHNDGADREPPPSRPGSKKPYLAECVDLLREAALRVASLSGGGAGALSGQVLSSLPYPKPPEPPKVDLSRVFLYRHLMGPSMERWQQPALARAEQYLARLGAPNLAQQIKADFAILTRMDAQTPAERLAEARESLDQKLQRAVMYLKDSSAAGTSPGGRYLDALDSQKRLIAGTATPVQVAAFAREGYKHLAYAAELEKYEDPFDVNRFRRDIKALSDAEILASNAAYLELESRR